MPIKDANVSTLEENALTVTKTPEQALVHHRRLTTRSLRARLRRFEARYEMPSSSLDDELRDGHLRETADIATWVVTWRAYQRLVSARPATRTG
jgi:hypothetical protein